MFKLRNKLNKKGGFTLIEMLIVVAIIAILVAVSIPLVGSALEKAREATDAANERAAKAEITIAYLGGDLNVSAGIDSVEVDTPYLYDAVNGVLKESTTTDTITAYGKCKDHKTNNILAVKVNDKGEVSLAWTTKGGTINDTDWNKGLCLTKVGK